MEGSIKLPRSLRKWLLGLDDKLSKDDGVQLLKILYSKDVPESDLDRVTTPKGIFVLYCGNHSVDEAAVVLVHRLRLLVPVKTPDFDAEEGATALEMAPDPVKILNAKDLGAQACLDYFEKCGVSRPDIRAEDLILQGAKLLESLVSVYVNVSPGKRNAIRERLAGQIGVYPYRDQVDLFNLFCRFLRSINSNDETESKSEDEIFVDRFVATLNESGGVPSPVTKRFINQLDSYNIRQTPYSSADIKVYKETEADCVVYTSPNIHHHHHHARQVCTKIARYCSCICLPLLLGVVVIIVAMPIFSRYLENNEFHRDNTGFLQLEGQCPNLNPLIKNAPVTMLVGKLNSFWYDSVSISQVKATGTYTYTNVDFFLIPSHQLKIHNIEYSCSKLTAYFDFIIYMLQGSQLNFMLCVHSNNDTYPGTVDFIICTTYPCYLGETEDYVEHHQIFVAPNETNCSAHKFAASHDSYYYLTTTHKHNATLESYTVNVTLLYLNSSFLKDKDAFCTSTDSKPNVCEVSIEKGSVFHAEEYAIVAISKTSSKYNVGNMKIVEKSRSLAYAVPGIAATTVTVLAYVTISLCVVIYCCLFRNRPNRSYVA